MERNTPQLLKANKLHSKKLRGLLIYRNYVPTVNISVFRAAFYVERAKQERQQKIVQAEGEAEAAKKLGEAVSLNPGYLKLRKIRAAQSIARTVS